MASLSFKTDFMCKNIGFLEKFGEHERLKRIDLAALSGANFWRNFGRNRLLNEFLYKVMDSVYLFVVFVLYVVVLLLSGLGSQKKI